MGEVRQYASSSIEDLEALFSAQTKDLRVLSQIVHELSFRSTKRALRLLSLVAERLTDNDVEPDDDVENIANDSLFPEGASEVPEDEESQVSGDYLVAAKGSSGSDQPPDDRKRPERLSQIRPVGTPGLPSAWTRKLDGDRPLNVAVDADIPQIYVAALTALIAEIKVTGAGQKRYELENGVRAEGKEAVYDFPFPEDVDLFEDAKVEVEVFGRRLSGSIVSISSGRLWLSTGEDLGPVLQRVILLVDATTLLEALKLRIEEASKGEINVNRPIADAVVGKAPAPADPAPIAEAKSKSSLNPAQCKAQQRALAASITYIWGPPGCGKTHVLSEIVRSALEANKRILVCSNTNKAVDQVLYRVCENLGKDHPAMELGHIVRLGIIADTKLKSEYSAFVTVDGIVERRSVDLKTRLTEVQIEIDRIDKQSAEARSIIDRFVQLDNAQKAVDFHLENTNKVARVGRDLNNELQSLPLELKELDIELEKRRTAVFGFFKRSQETIQKDIGAKVARYAKVKSEMESAKTNYTNARAQYEAAKNTFNKCQAQLNNLNRSAAERIIVDADKRRGPLVIELREIESRIADLRASVVKDARLLGSTCTKTYLSAKEIGKVDMVIIDEASMVLMPMVWFAAGLANDRVVICGDFRQIPPIVQTSQQSIFDVLGVDVFNAVGLDDLQVNDTRMVMLDTQYRMDEAICSLISEPMYQGQLATAATRANAIGVSVPPSPYDGTLTIIDTSDLWPFESVNAFFSRFNLMHALLARNLAWYFHREGYIQEVHDLAICTPYSAQSKLIRKLLDGEGFGNVIRVGTVHSFQGDERNAIVVELPEGHGGARMLGQFLQGVPPKHVGARLMNVAVSRAKNHLIVLANLTYLDRLLPSASLLRGILYEMQISGRVVAGRELLSLRPIESDLRGLFGHVPLDLDAKTLGVFNQSTFGAAIEADLANAKESIVIFSGFVTPTRVGKLGDLLRTKILDGIKVRCVTRPPKLNGTMDPTIGKKALDALEGIGCVVDCRARIHEKIVLIDKEIVWHGSLNVLSHTHRTDESMTRVMNAGLAEVLAANLSKRRLSAANALKAVGDAENPRCDVCNGRTVYNEGKFGPFFYCEDDCGWSVNLKALTKKSQTQLHSPKSDLPKEGPLCPLCNGKTKLQSGKNGLFYSCKTYPKCKGTVNIGKAK